MSENRPRTRRSHINPTAPIVGLFVAFDWMVVPMIEATDLPVAAGVLLGAVLGQFALLAIWAVIGPGRLPIRWPVTLLITALLYSEIFLGVLIVDPPSDALDAWFFGLSLLPSLFLAVQVPLWIFRVVTGCHMICEPGHAGVEAPDARQFGVRQLMGAVTVAALALGLARMAMSEDNGWAQDMVTEDLLELALGGAILTAWSALFALPSLYAAMGARDPVLGGMVMAVYVPVLSAVTALVFLIFAGPGGERVIGQAFLIFVLSQGAAITVMLGSLNWARRQGYVLLWPGRGEPAEKPAGESPFAETGEPSEEPPVSDKSNTPEGNPK